MPVIIFFVPLQSPTNDGIMTVDMVSYGTVPFGTLFAGYIGRNAMASPSGCCHTLQGKENILANLLKKCADYLAVWKIRIHTHTFFSRVFYKLFFNCQSITEKIFGLSGAFPCSVSPTTSLATHTSVRIDGENGSALRRPVQHEHHATGRRCAFIVPNNKKHTI